MAYGLHTGVIEITPGPCFQLFSCGFPCQGEGVPHGWIGRPYCSFPSSGHHLSSRRQKPAPRNAPS